MSSGPESPASIAFGRFRLFPHRRELLLDGQPIRLGGRAFDVLAVLVEARGSVVSKDALMRRIWPNQVVEENNLEVQISALRAAFGAERALIRTVARRGYQFTGEFRIPAEDAITRVRAGACPAAPEAVTPATNLVQPASELIGRDDNLLEVLHLAAAHRLVTLTGAGGIGKTRLALAAAHRLLPQFGDGIWVAELGPRSDPDLVPATVAAAAGLELATGAVTAERVANALKGKELLLLFDNCEHLIDAAAMTAEALLRANPAARVIATSREPLRAEGEHIYPVPPLVVPTADTDDKTDPLAYGAVRLFVDRARAAEPHFTPDGRLMAMLAVICRRLDGIPLAIELAAARVGALGIEGLAVRLDERFNLLTGGRRTALPRHQTMRATLDWSHGLLAEPERIVLRRLAIFAGPFSLEAAGVVAVSPGLARSDAIEGLLSLVAKSLVVAATEGAIAHYRLLETTRAYAFEKLAETGELQDLARCHARYFRDLFERAEAEWETRPTAEWLADYGRHIDNLRAALDWAFSPGGDASIGVALTAAAASLWMQLSLLDECRSRVERAFAVLQAGTSHDARQEMKLCAALGGSLLFTTGSLSAIGIAWTRALTIAEGLPDPEYQLRALWGLWVYRMHSGDWGIGLGLAQRFASLAQAQGDPTDLAVADRMIAVSLHYRGDQTDARRHIERMVAHYVAPVRRSPSARFLYDQKALAHVALARILWVQGFPDRAWSIVQSNIEDALTRNDVTALCYTLAEVACPIAFFIGDLVAAERYAAMLLDRGVTHELPVWQSWGRRFQGTLLISNGDLERGLQVLLTALEQRPGTTFQPRVAWFLAQLAWGFGRAGQIAEATVTINEALTRAERNGDRWYLAELLRLKGELLLSEPDGTPTAEPLFREALDVARRQNALSFELRAATSLTRLLRDQGRLGDARACLQPVYDRFTEGFDTADLKAAKLLLDELRTGATEQ